MDKMIKDTLQDSMLKITAILLTEPDSKTEAEIKNILKSSISSYNHLRNTPTKSLLLACKILISEKFKDLKLECINIRLCCYNMLSNYLHEKFFLKEFRSIKRLIKSQIFNPLMNRNNLSNIISLFFKNEDLKQMKIKYPKIDRCFSTSKIEKISFLDDKVLRVLTYLEYLKYIITEDLYHILNIFPKNRKCWANLKQFLVRLSIDGDMQNEAKAILINILDEKLNHEIPDTSIVELICLKIDRNIKSYLLNVENVKEESITVYSQVPEKVPVITKTILQISDDDENALKSLAALYNCTPVGSFAAFDALFASMLLSIINAYIVPIEFYYFYCLRSVSSLDFKLSDRYKVLKKLPENISSAIMEMMLILSSSNDSHYSSNPSKAKAQIIKFFVKKVKTSICYSHLSESTVIRFYDLLRQPPFINILIQFYNGESLEKDLLAILNKITIMKLPRILSGLFQKTHHITLKIFRKGTEIHLQGAYFLTLLHELAHYLQRVDCMTVSESNKPFSPQHNNGNPSTEGGYLLEEHLFGSVSEKITKEQSEFLMSGIYPDSINDFQSIFKMLEGIKGSSPVLYFRKDDDALYLGTCGFNATSN